MIVLNAKEKNPKNIRNAFLWSNWSIFNTQVLHGAQKTATSPTVRGTGWWTTAETDNGIKGIDPQFAISSPFLPSVKQLPRGDGFHLQKKWINGSCKEGVAVVVEWQWSGCPPPPPSTPPLNQMMLFSGQDGGGRDVIDNAPAGEELPRASGGPQRGLREQKLPAHLLTG